MHVFSSDRDHPTGMKLGLKIRWFHQASTGSDRNLLASDTFTKQGFVACRHLEPGFKFITVTLTHQSLQGLCQKIVEGKTYRKHGNTPTTYP